jgi:AraC family transcriptional activator of pobA
MSKRAADLPILNLESQTFPGLHIRNLEKQVSQLPLNTLHRDDYLIFLLQFSGESVLEIDFFKSILHQSSICYILPRSVHQLLSVNTPKGWLLAVNSDLIDERFRLILLEGNAGSPIPIHPDVTSQLESILSVIYQQHHMKTHKSFPVMNHLVSAFAGILCRSTSLHMHANPADRSSAIVAQFKNLLRKHYRQQKSPSWYASQLNLSTSYLNECIKSATGTTVSNWIQKEIVLEGKRLLAFTKNSTKEIAYDLGYNDPAYFNRLFLKITGTRPAAFRNNYHK